MKKNESWPTLYAYWRGDDFCIVFIKQVFEMEESYSLLSVSFEKKSVLVEDVPKSIIAAAEDSGYTIGSEPFNIHLMALFCQWKKNKRYGSCVGV